MRSPYVRLRLRAVQCGTIINVEPIRLLREGDATTAATGGGRAERTESQHSGESAAKGAEAIEAAESHTEAIEAAESHTE
jgi:hypothetical protein